MLEHAAEAVPDEVPGRWLALCFLEGDTWAVVLEPDPMRRTSVVVTAYLEG